MSWKKQYREQVDSRDDSDYFKLQPGINVFRVLPNHRWAVSDDPGDEPSVIEYLKHRDVGPKKRMATCGKRVQPDGTVAGDCYLCDIVIPKLSQSANPVDRDRAAGMVPVPFTLMQVSPVRNGQHQPPKIFELTVGGGRSWGGKVIDLLLREDKFYEHPVKGRNFIIHKKVDPSKVRYISYMFL